MRCAAMLWLLSALATVRAGEVGKNLIRNGGFDAPGAPGWFLRKGMRIAPGGAYQTPCLRVEMPPDAKYPNFYFAHSEKIPARPNRTYEFQCLVKTAHTAGTAEAAVRLVNQAGKSIAYKRADPFGPGKRDWTPVKILFTTPRRVATMQIYFIHRGLKGPVWYDECSLRLRRPAPMPPIGRGAAVTFEAGPGALPMRVENAEERNGKIYVTTTGARYVFGPAAGVIEGSQRIGARRPAVSIRFPRGLRGLRLVRRDAAACVLSTGDLDIGVQCDSLLVFAAKARRPVACTGRIAGKWARVEGPYVLAIDDRGGVGVYPHVIVGSGEYARAKRLPSVDALKRPGWTCEHEIGGPARLGVSIFPPRPYDWEKSFKWRLCHTGCDYPPDRVLKEWSRYATHVCLHANAMWQGPHPWMGPYKMREPDQFRRVLATCKRLGMTVMPYMSPWYYHVRDPKAFIEQLAERKAKFGFGGVYYDGLWYDDWLLSYRVMRMTRALFPKGCVYVHTTIGPPLFSKTICCPFIDTYADLVLRGESYPAKGPNDPYVRYIAAGYRVSNAIGMMKGNKWKGVKAKEQIRIMLSYNGRARWGTYPRKDKEGRWVFPGQKGPIRNLFTTWYFPELDRLEREWRAGRWRP